MDRDVIALKVMEIALANMLERNAAVSEPNWMDLLAKVSYGIADAMLEERAKAFPKA